MLKQPINDMKIDEIFMDAPRYDNQFSHLFKLCFTALRHRHQTFKSPTVLTRDTFAFLIFNKMPLIKSTKFTPIDIEINVYGWNTKEHQDLVVDAQTKKPNYCLSTWKNGDILSNATYMIGLTDCQQSIKTQSCCLRISKWKKKWLAKRYRQFSEVVSFARSQVTIKQSYVGDFGTTKEWATSRGRSVIYYKTEIQIGIHRRKDCIFFPFVCTFNPFRLNVILFATMRISTWYPFWWVFVSQWRFVYFPLPFFGASPTWMQCVFNFNNIHLQREKRRAPFSQYVPKLYQMFDLTKKKIV